jgi:hypothetical protein
MNTTLLGLPVLLIITYLASKNWRRAIEVALVLVILEGALRKWVLPEASQLIYFLKDFVLFGAYLRYFLFDSKHSRLMNRYNILLVLLGLNLVWMITQVLNPSLGSPIIGIFGLKNYLFYVPLMWMLPRMFHTEEELLHFIRYYLLWLIPVGLLAIVQFFAPSDSPLNVYAWGDEGPDVALGGDSQSARVTGTFSYIAGYSTYLFFCIALLLPLLINKQPRFWQWIAIGGFLLIAITSFMTGSRGLVLSVILLLIGYFIILGSANLRSLLISTKNLFFPVLIAVIVVAWQFRGAVDVFMLRVTANNDISGRISSGFLEPFLFAPLKGLDGYGAGSTFQATPILRSLLSLPPGEYIPVYYEGEMGRVTLELGLVGFFLWYGLRLLLLVALWQTYRKLKRPLLRQLALSIFLHQTIIFTGLVVFNHTANLYYWFFNGFILLLPQLERQAIPSPSQDLLLSQQQNSTSRFG